MIKRIIYKIHRLYFIYNLFDRNLTALYRFIKLNFFSNNVRRYGHVFIYPYPHTTLRLSSSAIIELYGDLHIGVPTIKGKGQTSRLVMGEYSRITVNRCCQILEGCDIKIVDRGIFTVDNFHSNIGLEMLCGYQIRLIGEVTAGRHVRLKDYNGHSTNYSGYPMKNAIIIEDHVWLCTGTTVNAGCYIESGSVIADNSNLTERVPANSFVQGNPAKITKMDITFQI